MPARIILREPQRGMPVERTSIRGLFLSISQSVPLDRIALKPIFDTSRSLPRAYRRGQSRTDFPTAMAFLHRCRMPFSCSGQLLDVPCSQLSGAGSENRTRVTSMGNWRTATVLYPLLSYESRILLDHLSSVPRVPVFWASVLIHLFPWKSHYLFFGVYSKPILVPSRSRSVRLVPLVRAGLCNSSRRMLLS